MIALYPGAFKPPHRGHFEVVKRLLKGNHGGHIYTKDSAPDASAKALAGQKGKVEKITKVIVFPGGGERNGITKGESMAIWKIYAKYLPGVEVLDGEKNPMFAAKDYAAANEGEQFYAVTGIRDESDVADLRRITTFKNVNNVQGLLIPSAEGAGVRATDLRAAALSGNLDELRDFFPKELKREELLTILKMLKDNIIAEVMNQKMEDLFEAMFESKEETTTEEPSVVETKPELKEYIASVLEYMLDQGMKITPLPEVKTRHDEVEASNFFGKTAYYDPGKKEIVLFTAGRHPKDIVRSFVHEMIHHIQNLEGRLVNISTSNTNEDDNLLEIEKEAYLQGNITFRNWEDSVKNEPKKEVIAEGRYDAITTYLTNKSIEAVKMALTKKLNHFKEGHFGDPTTEDARVQMKTVMAESYPILLVSIPDDLEKDFQRDPNLEFDYEMKVIFVKGINQILRDGSADMGGWKGDTFITPEVEVNFVLDPYNFPGDFEELSSQITDVLRHEIEHLTQSGGNERNKRFDKNAQFGGEFGTRAERVFRTKMRDGIIANGKQYLILPSEIDANIQGMYLSAKKAKRPFVDVVDQYLYAYTEQYDKDGKPYLTKQDVEDVKKVWGLRLKSLGIKQKL
jgi:hypothetical protein